MLIVLDSGVGFSASSPAGLLVKPVKSLPLGQPGRSHQAGGMDRHPLRQPLTPKPLKIALATHKKESEGLGLLIVRKLCDLLGASLVIDSSPGTGTRIHVRFLSNTTPTVTANLVKTGGLR